jgi:ribonuclease HII
MHKKKNEAGCDEAGRGCLAGPVFAAAVILPDDFKNELLNDSKQLNEKNRYALRKVIEEQALCYSVAMLDNHEIDRINILNASIKAMHLALSELTLKPLHIVVDGNRFKKFENIAHTTVVKGDGKYANIAAASILAKTYRDDYMLRIHEEYPLYDWKSNKGYPTIKHREAIAAKGTSPYHRLTFRLLPQQPELPFDQPTQSIKTRKIKKNA